jgi:gamma-glutamyl-gamma-aminobutyrate hydrolase PuuD
VPGMSRPRVLVTLGGDDAGGALRHSVRERHLHPLLAAGLLPVLVTGTLPPDALAELAGDCRGAYLPGTEYVPSRSGESDAESRAGARAAGLAWDPQKVRADFAVISVAWERRLPLLGICGGMQAMVVAAGGTLRPGTADQVAQHADHAGTEPATLTDGTLAAAVLAGGAEPNSFHRQVVDRVSDPLVIGVRAADGVVEAVEAPPDIHPFWLGLQWHPELLDDARPFSALARAAARRS